MKEKVNGTDKVKQIKNVVPTAPLATTKYGIAFGAGPHELAGGIERMVQAGYSVHGGVYSHTVKTGWFKTVRLMCVLMSLDSWHGG